MTMTIDAKLELSATVYARPWVFPAERPRSSASKIRVRSCGLTDVGHSRGFNEDACSNDDVRQLYVVADGVGGGNRGDLASSMAVDAVQASIKDGDTARRAGSQSLEEAIHEAHSRIRDAIRGDDDLRGMGTTIVALRLAADGSAEIAHVGDSRAYRLRDGQLELLTRDHTLATELVAWGSLSREEAESHPLNHVLTRSLSSTKELDVETATTSVRSGDVFLLCSDGLTKMLTDEEIRLSLDQGGEPEEFCHRLIRLALWRGGDDNVTVVVAEIL